MLPDGVVTARHCGVWRVKRSLELIESRISSAIGGKHRVVPISLADVVDHRVRTFRRHPTWIAPPDLSEPRHDESKASLACGKIEIVEEPVDVHGIGQFLHHTIEHKEAVDTGPVIDAFIFQDAARRQNGDVSGERIEGEIAIGRSHPRTTDQRVQ